MNNYFASIGKKLSKVFQYSITIFCTVNNSYLQFHMVHIDVEFVSYTIAKFSARLLKDGSHVISPVLTSLINKSI